MFETFFKENYEILNPDAKLFHDLLEAISRVTNLIEYKDTHHSERVALNSMRLARRLKIDNKSELAQLYFAGLLHDVGEVGIPDVMLHKKGKLSEEEFQLLTTHTAIGQQIGSQVAVLDIAANLILWHHERWDGTGYPEGLTADETPLLAQIVSICDAFDNIRRGGLFSQPEEWERELQRCSGIQFNPRLVTPLIGLTHEGHTDDIERSDDDDAVIEAVESQDEVIGPLRKDDIGTLMSCMLTLLEAKHKESAVHSRRVARLCETMAGRIRLSPLETETLVISGLLHDIGKMGVPNSILDKPALLDDWEYGIVQKHPEHAATILEPLVGFEEVKQTILYHHERWDGSGYPEGLAGENIPLLSRVLHVCDLADALSHVRVIPKREAGRVRYVIEDGFGSYFDPELSQYFEGDMLDHDAEELA
jgi:HD-GYP domain-containing protein (c-di-GMP phosphodiesterase class II)